MMKFMKFLTGCGSGKGGKFCREEHVHLANLAMQAGRHEEVIEFMEKVVNTADVLTVEESSLLFKAYERVILAMRTSWINTFCIEQNEENEDVSFIKAYRGKIQTELTKSYHEILNLLDSHLVPTASLSESKVFNLTLKGDCLRYLTDFMAGAEREEALNSSLVAYMSAQDIALDDLAPTDPTRLELALKLSAFYYENHNSHDCAARLAKQAYFDAYREQLRLGEEPQRDSLLIMELLLQNLTLWECDTGVDLWECDTGVDVQRRQVMIKVSRAVGRIFAELAGVSFPKPEPEEEKPAETGQ